MLPQIIASFEFKLFNMLKKVFRNDLKQDAPVSADFDFDVVPDPVQAKILSYLTIYELMNILNILSKKFNKMISNETIIWKHLNIKNLSISFSRDYKSDYGSDAIIGYLQFDSEKWQESFKFRITDNIINNINKNDKNDKNNGKIPLILNRLKCIETLLNLDELSISTVKYIGEPIQHLVILQFLLFHKH